MRETLRAEYIQHIGDDLGVVNAARISYLKEKLELVAGDVKLINYLADHQHMTPFEHNSLTMRISCPLFIRSQIHRHRTFSYNEVSRRYTSDGIEFYMYPSDDVRSQSKSNKQGSESPVEKVWADTFCRDLETWQSRGQQLYEEYVGLGIAREQARSFLGVNLVTHFYMTANFRNWMHFLGLRLESHAQKEVRIIASDVAEVILQYWPISFAALSKNWLFQYTKTV